MVSCDATGANFGLEIDFSTEGNTTVGIGCAIKTDPVSACSNVQVQYFHLMSEGSHQNGQQAYHQNWNFLLEKKSY